MEQPISVRLSISRFIMILWVIAASLTAMSVCEQAIIHLLERDDLEEYLIIFDLDAEANIPTWFSSALMLAACALAGLIATLIRREGGKFVRHWWGLAFGFALMSLDETAQAHENLGLLHSVSHTHGLLYYAWVIPATALVAAIGLAYWPMLRGIPSPLRRRLLIAAAFYLGGAIGMEALGGWHAEAFGDNNFGHSIIATVEEALEMAGLILLIHALLRHIQFDFGRIDVRLVEIEPDASHAAHLRQTTADTFTPTS